MNIREIENYGLKILTEKAKDGSMTVYAKFTETEIPNQNSRTYPLGIMTREVDRLQSKISAGQFLGQSDHSDSPATFLKDVSHVVTKLEMIGNNGYATIKILNTSAGKNVQEIIKGKGKIGISTRSVGTISASGVVQKDLRLLALDLVANPSVADATIGKENILEGIEFENKDKNMKSKLMGLTDTFVEEMMADVFKIYVKEENFKGSYEDFKIQNGDIVLAEILRAEGKFETIEEATKHLNGFSALEKEINVLEKRAWLSAVIDGGFKGDQNEWNEMMGIKKDDGEIRVQKLTEQQIEDRTYSYFLEAQAGGFMGDFNAWKEKFPQLVEMAREQRKIVEAKKEIRAPEKLKMIWNEVLAGGFVGTISEWKEQYPGMELILPVPPQEVKKVVAEEILTEDELTKEAARIFTALSKEGNSLTLEDVKKLLEKEQEEKVDIRIRRKAIQIVAREADGTCSQEMLEKMVAEEIENLKKERKERRERNWEAYRKLLSD